MAVDRALSPTQQSFLQALFTTCNGNLKQAALEVIGSEDYSGFMTDEMLAAIKKRSDQQLQMASAKAVLLMQTMLENPEMVPFMDKTHKVCADILDRAGISKQERASGGNTLIGVVFLPTKATLPEPPTIDGAAKVIGPVLKLSVNEIQTETSPQGA